MVLNVPVGNISEGGRRKAYSPVSLSSIPRFKKNVNLICESSKYLFGFHSINKIHFLRLKDNEL